MKNWKEIDRILNMTEEEQIEDLSTFFEEELGYRPSVARREAAACVKENRQNVS